MTLTFLSDLPTFGERWATWSPAETPPAWVNVSAARAATVDAEGPPASRTATAPAAAARAPLKSASTWPTTPSTMEPPISAVGFSYSSTWLVGCGVAAVDDGAEVRGDDDGHLGVAVVDGLARGVRGRRPCFVARMSERSLLVRIVWMAAPAFWPASAPPLSRFATTTLVAAMSNDWPPPKAKPSRAARPSGATSIMISAGRLRSVLRRSFQAMARILVTAAGATRAARGRSGAGTPSRGSAP